LPLFFPRAFTVRHTRVWASARRYHHLSPSCFLFCTGHARHRFNADITSIVDPNGDSVLSSGGFAALFDGMSLSGVDVDENGISQAGATVWTNADRYGFGLGGADACVDFTSTSFSYTMSVGVANRNSSTWYGDWQRHACRRRSLSHVHSSSPAQACVLDDDM